VPGSLSVASNLGRVSPSAFISRKWVRNAHNRTLSSGVCFTRGGAQFRWNNAGAVNNAGISGIQNGVQSKRRNNNILRRNQTTGSRWDRKLGNPVIPVVGSRPCVYVIVNFSIRSTRYSLTTRVRMGKLGLIISVFAGLLRVERDRKTTDGRRVRACGEGRETICKTKR